MPVINVAVETPISQSTRAQQVSSMFDVPMQKSAKLSWTGALPIEAQPWHVGLIVGPSGAGKTTIMRSLFGEPTAFAWTGASVIDDFDPRFGVEAVAAICQAVGFNTIPAWLRPYRVLSNGEQFRVDLARRLLEGGALVVCDEFTSVVDRQTAHIGANAVQKFIRKHDRQFVAVTCHYDLEDWLQPDWVFEPATMAFRWRSVQRRPDIECTINRAPHDAWLSFAPFHYLTANLHRNARCYVLKVNDTPAAFAGVLNRPHPRVDNLFGMSRLVTLPDFQGLGLAFALADRIGAAYKAIGKRYHAYPAHPMLIRSFDRSPMWHLEKKPGRNSNPNRSATTSLPPGGFGGRPCAVFSYAGPIMDRALAAQLIG